MDHIGLSRFRRLWATGLWMHGSPIREAGQLPWQEPFTWLELRRHRQGD